MNFIRSFKIKNILNIFCKPVRVYRALVIFVSSVIIYSVVYNEELSAENKSNRNIDTTSNRVNGDNNIKDTDEEYKSDPRTKYVLFWTPDVTPLNLIEEEGQKAFISNGCKFTNCFVTHNRQYFANQSHFDAIIFSIAALDDLQELPKERSSRQKFVAASIEPPEKYPVAYPKFDGYFNWTWTFRLDSDILWRYFRIFDSKGKEIGPRMNMKWSQFYLYQSSDYFMDDIEIDLSAKNKAVMWIKSCNHKNQHRYIDDLVRELYNFGLSLDTYSNCTIGHENCGNKRKCNNRIAKNYYFYLAFEEYLDEDYVTNTLLFAVQNLVVPVVTGNSNYFRFLPPGSYLNAKYLSPSELASFIDTAVGNFSIFRKYFNWFKHYTYKSSLKSEICNLCNNLNNRKMVDNITVYDNFRKMWNGENSTTFFDYLYDDFKNDESLEAEARNGNYVEMRKLFKNKFLLQGDTFGYTFDISPLNLTTTEETNFIPFELTTDIENEEK